MPVADPLAAAMDDSVRVSAFLGHASGANWNASVEARIRIVSRPLFDLKLRPVGLESTRSRKALLVGGGLPPWVVTSELFLDRAARRVADRRTENPFGAREFEWTAHNEGAQT
jgi:hypothetical protein